LELINFLTAYGVAPFAGALAAMFVFFFVEAILSMVAGVGVTHFVQSAMSSHHLPDTSFTNWLFVKEVPLMLVLSTFISAFGLGGITTQALHMWLFDVPYGRLEASPVVYLLALAFAFVATHYLAKLIGKMQLVSTTALEPHEFIGGVATLTSKVARKGYAGSANFTDKHGYVHLLMVEPVTDEEIFNEGNRVELVHKASASLYHARRT